MSSNRNYSKLTIKKLFGSAAARCSMCQTKLMIDATESDDAIQVGEIAHIVASSSDGPRGDANFPQDKLDDYENLILLCPTCHKKIDKQPNSYSISDLKKIKDDHEKWVDKNLEKSSLNVTSIELEMVIRNISSGDYSSTVSFNDFDHIDVSDKINKNDFSNRIKRQLEIGLYKTYEVKSFVIEMDKIDGNFVKNLKLFFKETYLELKNQCEDNDEIFIELFNQISGGDYSFDKKAAALSVLCYMFELCEVFEK